MNRTLTHSSPPERSLRLAQLLVVRLCDDVGSLLAGARAELGLTGEVEPASTAMNGVDALSRRLTLLRACWGPGTLRLTARTVASLAEGLPNALRLRLDLSGLPRRTALSSIMSRVVLNVLMLASESLPRGGMISIAGQKDGCILVSISGTHAGWPREFSRLLNRPEAAWAALTKPKRLLSPLVVLIAADAGVRLSFLRSVDPAISALLLSPV